MLGSMGAGDLFSPWGTLTELASTRSGECDTVVLVLRFRQLTCSASGIIGTYRLISSLGVLPVTSFSQASAHSRTMSMAYFLFLHSPEKANWFSGLPSGIL